MCSDSVSVAVEEVKRYQELTKSLARLNHAHVELNPKFFPLPPKTYQSLRIERVKTWMKKVQQILSAFLVKLAG